MLQQIKNDVLHQKKIDKTTALWLYNADIEELAAAALEIQESFCGKSFAICAIINAKSGKCPEDCSYCAQSQHYNGEDILEYPLLGDAEILKEAIYNSNRGIIRYGIVTSGKKLNGQELKKLCQSYKLMKEKTQIGLCGSLGLLSYRDFLALKAAGMTRYHNNLETSANFFPNICTTHTYSQKLDTIKAAQKAGLEICSGGIIGLGESIEDRIDMALMLRELNIKSIPLNILTPIKGTPLASQKPLSYEEIRRTVALYRFILPHATLRLAGGRGSLADKGELLFQSGANGVISGDMLTTPGISIKEDLAIIRKLKYEVNHNE